MRRTLALLLSAACAGDPPPPPPSTASAVLAPGPELLAAGTGALTRLAMALAREVSTRTALRIRVEPSIGWGGGIAATRDGAVDLGLVSRLLRPDEAAGLERDEAESANAAPGCSERGGSLGCPPDCRSDPGSATIRGRCHAPEEDA